MDQRRSSRLSKSSKKSTERKPSIDKDVIHPRLGYKRQRTGLKRIKSSNGIVNADERGSGILELANSAHETEYLAEGDFIDIFDKEVDKSEDDCSSVTSSVASGPSLSYPARLSQGRCSACQKLYQKAKRMKAPIKNKLLDNDPRSLTCDQWALIKKWSPARMPNAGRKLLNYNQLVTKRLSTNVVEQYKQYFGETSACSRPHIYLKRNLRCCVKAPVRENRRRKRTRNDCQGSCVAKKKHLQSNVWCHLIGLTNDNSCHSATGHNSISGREDCNDQEIHPLDTTLTESSSPVTLEATRSTELPHKRMTPKKMRGFRDLFAQLCSNSSMIVRETH